MFDSLQQIDAEHVDGCSADWRLAAKHRAVPCEVFIPIVEPWIEEWLQFVAFGIVAGDVGALVAVARQTGEREIGSRRRTRVLLGADMVKLKGLDVEFLRNAAVFAPSARSVPHALATENCHRLGTVLTGGFE